MLPESLKPYAKAIAGFLTPIALALLAKLLDATGIETPVDPSAVETVVVAIVTAGLVYATRNRSETVEEQLAELERLRAANGPRR